MQIAGRAIGPDAPVYVIAELSANHNGSFDQAAQLVREAKLAGADAIKVQTYTADTLTFHSDRPEFQVGGGTLWDGRTLHSLYEEAHMPWEWQPRLKVLADELGIHFFSTPFDATAVTFLEAMAVPAYKVASFELVDLPLIERIAKTGKPMILSTGMATVAEIDEAVTVARRAGATALALLKCTSAYPAPYAGMDLQTIPHLAATFAAVAGLSDHTLGITVPVAAVALGARIIEKHFTLSRAEPGPDSAFSLEPAEFRAMVDAVRATESALGRIRYGPSPEEQKSLAFRRSLFVVADVKAGEPLTEMNVRSIRPSHGLPPKYLAAVLGRRATRDIGAGEPLAWDLIGPKPVPGGETF